MPISAKIPTEKMTMIAINWSLAKYSCPSWSANTDESALRSALATLDDLGSSLHWWLGFWTALVVIGVAMEVVFVIWEYREDLHDFKRGIIRAPDKPKMSLFVLGLLGAGLVAAGVAGELREESKIATLETCIRAGNNALSLLLSKEAGDAKESAASAQSSASVIGQQADILKAEVRRLIFLGPRDLLLLESTKPFDVLKKFPAQQFRFSVCRDDIPPGDFFETEVGGTLRAILKQLRNAGWKGVSMDPIFANSPVPLPYFNKTCGSVLVAVGVSEHPSTRTSEAAAALQSVLNYVLLQGARLNSQKDLSPDPGPDVIDIHVGSHSAYPAAVYKLQNEER